MAEIELRRIVPHGPMNRLLCPQEEASFIQQVFNFLLDHPDAWSTFSSTVRDLRGVTSYQECLLRLLPIAKDRRVFTKPSPNPWGGQKAMLDQQKTELLRAMALVRQSWLEETRDEPVLPARSRGVEHEPDLRPLPLVQQDGCLPFGSPVLVRQNGERPP